MLPALLSSGALPDATVDMLVQMLIDKGLLPAAGTGEDNHAQLSNAPPPPVAEEVATSAQGRELVAQPPPAPAAPPPPEEVATSAQGRELVAQPPPAPPAMPTSASHPGEYKVFKRFCEGQAGAQELKRAWTWGSESPLFAHAVFAVAAVTCLVLYVCAHAQGRWTDTPQCVRQVHPSQRLLVQHAYAYCTLHFLCLCLRTPIWVPRT